MRPILALGGLVALSAALLAWGIAQDRYGLAAATREAAWRIDLKTGDVSVCRAVSLLRPPVCSPFGADPVPAPRPPQAAAPAPPAPPAPGPQAGSMTPQELEAFMAEPLGSALETRKTPPR